MNGPLQPAQAAINAARGETMLMINGRPRRLLLTLGALSELEAAFGASDLAILAERLSRPSAQDLAVVIAALLRGAGEDLPMSELSAAQIDFVAAAEAVALAFTRAFQA